MPNPLQPEVTTMDRNWIKFGLEMAKARMQRQLDSTTISDAVRDAVKKDLKSIEETFQKFS